MDKLQRFEGYMKEVSTYSKRYAVKGRVLHQLCRFISDENNSEMIGLISSGVLNKRENGDVK